MIGPEPVFVPQAPGIGTQQGARPEEVYRQMEAASEARTELMAQHGGGSASDYSHTKITNLSDSRYPGDAAAILPPQNQVRQFAAQHPTMGGGYTPLAGGTGVEYAERTRSGPYPYAGAMSSDQVRSMHQTMRRKIEWEGRINKK